MQKEMKHFRCCALFICACTLSPSIDTVINVECTVRPGRAMHLRTHYTVCGVEKSPDIAMYGQIDLPEPR
jgi:hypothetical protein